MIYLKIRRKTFSGNLNKLNAPITPSTSFPNQSTAPELGLNGQTNPEEEAKGFMQELNQKNRELSTNNPINSGGTSIENAGVSGGNFT